MEEEKRASEEYKECEMFSVANFKEIHNKLYARQFLQVDLKTNNMSAHVWGKIVN